MEGDLAARMLARKCAAQEGLLRRYHALGAEALARWPPGEPNDHVTAVDIARREGISVDNILRSRQFAAAYTQRELDELCALRTPQGQLLSWGVVRRLGGIKSRPQRRKWQQRAAAEGLTAAQLNELIRKPGEPRRAGGGRPFAAPTDVAAGLQHLVSRCEEWVRRCRSSWAEDAIWVQQLGVADAARAAPALRALVDVARAALETEARLRAALERPEGEQGDDG